MNNISHLMNSEILCHPRCFLIYIVQLTLFLIAPRIFSNGPSKKLNIYECDWSKFNCQELILDYFAIDQPQILKLQHNNIDASFQNFLGSMSKILGKHSPLKKLTEYKLKFKTKPWITSVLQKSISLKNKIFKCYINTKHVTKKPELQNNHESCRNILPTLKKKSKQNYFSKIISPIFLKTT